MSRGRGLKEGANFNIDYVNKEWPQGSGRVNRDITKAKEVTGTTALSAGQASRGPRSSAEAEIWAAFCAFAAAGKVECDGQSIGQVIRTLQLAHSHVFGNLGTFRASEASSWGTQQ